jgi:hypothetical protein
MCSVHGHVGVLAFDSKRYVGAKIGIYNPRGEKVGRVSHLQNLEYVLVAGARETVEAMTGSFGAALHAATMSGHLAQLAARVDPAAPAGTLLRKIRNR